MINNQIRLSLSRLILRKEDRLCGKLVLLKTSERRSEA